MNWSKLTTQLTPTLPTEDMFTVVDFATHYHIARKTASDHILNGMKAGIIQRVMKYNRLYYYQLVTGETARGPKKTRASN